MRFLHSGQASTSLTCSSISTVVSLLRAALAFGSMFAAHSCSCSRGVARSSSPYAAARRAYACAKINMLKASSLVRLALQCKGL